VVNRPSGIEVADVISGGPAARSGLKMGDIIVAVDDTPVNTTRGLYDEIAFKNPGQTIAVSILRNDKPFSIKVKTEAAPEEVAASIPDAAPSLTVAEMNYGFTVVDLTKDLANKFGVTATSGLIVTAAQRGSKLAVGDVITQFNGKPVPNAKAFIAALGALKPGQSWTMSLAPKGNEDPPFRVMRAPNE
jgi:serine protease Do